MSSRLVAGLGVALAASISFAPQAAGAAAPPSARPIGALDDAAPLAPVVTSTSFPECSTMCPHDGTPVGVEGTFEVGAAKGDTDVDAYRWAILGPVEGEPSAYSETILTKAGRARSISFTSHKTGLRNLQVQARDKAGVWGHTASYSFYVPANEVVTEWSFGDPSDPGANSGADPTTGTLDLGGAVTSSVGRRDTGLQLRGGAPATAASTGVSTGQDFAVALWAHVDAAESVTLMSVPTAEGNAFEIGYDATDGSWLAGRRSATGAELASAPGGRGAWTHLAATYASSDDALTLWVNGKAVDTVAYSGEAWDGSRWQLGCGSVALPEPRCGDATVDEIGLWDNRASAPAIAERLRLEDETGYATSMAAEWNLGVSTDTVESGVLTDRSFGAPLQVAGIGDQYLSGGFLALPGTTGQSLTLGHPVTDSAVSFSVAASLRLTDPTRGGVIAQQAGENAAAWTLGYRLKSDGSGGQVYFQMADGDSVDATVAEVRADVWTPEEVNVVVAVYDVDLRRIEIYLNGMSPAFGDGSPEGEMPEASFTMPWTARGPFAVGNGTTTLDLAGPEAPLAAEVKGVWQYAGQLSANDIFNADIGLPPGAATPGG
ncbi:LamG-like jellyroll fold domain-containing protein [Nocardioides sp. CCNWLW239]|uniref:LamG-like jellyroll fold domain-containing protein n=1 Tax=Nocardioides sp. CCNWLW239 TaxID=3128902 RepID=UPI003016B843